jgi:prevent-host-death family protein
VKTVAAGEFKQTCLRLLDEVGESGEPIVITKRNKPVAQLVPVGPERPDDWRGAMRNRGQIHADLLPPALDSAEWHAMRV